MTAMRERTTVGRRSGRRRPSPVEPARHEATPALPLDEPTSEPPVVAAVEEPEVVLEPAGSETLPPEPEDPDERDRPAEPAADEPSDSAEPSAEAMEPEEPEGPEPAEEAEAAPKPAARRKQQRPSVPSWDDIMFGAKRD